MHDEPLEQLDRVLAVSARVYLMSRATKSMQVDYAPYCIRVNARMPSTIHTPLVDRYLRERYPTVRWARDFWSTAG